MKPLRIPIIFILILATAGPLAAAENEAPKLPVKLRDRPNISLLPSAPPDDALIRRVKELIASFANLDNPDLGIPDTMSERNFAPIPDKDYADTSLLFNQDLGETSALKELVTIGPDALPFLLDALDDKTPTKIIVTGSSGLGGMWFDRELEVNPVNPAENGISNEPTTQNSDKKYTDTYTVKIGDACFVAIGQIVGRSYKSIRGQPTACIVLNSPTNDPALCARVRSIWKSDNPRVKLFDSLCADYATVGIFDGESLEGWEIGNKFQCAAALRMSFYFPKETGGLLANRLEKLNVGKDVGIDDYMRRCVANGVRSEYFINALAWSFNPAIKSALIDVFKRTNDPQNLLAALPAVEDKNLIRQQLEAALTALPTDDPGPYGDANHLLTALLKHSPDTTKTMFDRYLQNPTTERRHTVCLTLLGANVPWDIDILRPMLTDKRTFGWDFSIIPGQNEPRLPIRICDVAAVTLNQNHAALKFTQGGQYVDMDRQIAAMRTILADKKTP